MTSKRKQAAARPAVRNAWSAVQCGGTLEGMQLSMQSGLLVAWPMRPRRARRGDSKSARAPEQGAVGGSRWRADSVSGSNGSAARPRARRFMANAVPDGPSGRQQRRTRVGARGSERQSAAGLQRERPQRQRGAAKGLIDDSDQRAADGGKPTATAASEAPCFGPRERASAPRGQLA